MPEFVYQQESSSSLIELSSRFPRKWFRFITRRRYVCVPPLAGLLILGGSMGASAQSGGAGIVAPVASVLSHDAEGKVVIRATRVPQPIRIDGRIDEEVYKQVPAITEFIQQVPKEGAPVTEKTEAWVLFDDNYVYIACRFWDSRPERIVANDMRRDSANLNRQDRCDVSLDTMHDRRSNYLFTVTPLGGMRDGYGTDEVMNFDWNGVWDAGATLFDQGWMAEIAIPFKTLRYQPGRDQTWGLHLRRVHRGRNEWSYIVPVQAAGVPTPSTTWTQRRRWSASKRLSARGTSMSSRM